MDSSMVVFDEGTKVSLELPEKIADQIIIHSPIS